MLTYQDAVARLTKVAPAACRSNSTRLPAAVPHTATRFPLLCPQTVRQFSFLVFRKMKYFYYVYEAARVRPGT